MYKILHIPTAKYIGTYFHDGFGRYWTAPVTLDSIKDLECLFGRFTHYFHPASSDVCIILTNHSCDYPINLEHLEIIEVDDV